MIIRRTCTIYLSDVEIYISDSKAETNLPGSQIIHTKFFYQMHQIVAESAVQVFFFFFFNFLGVPSVVSNNMTETI